MNWKAFWLNIFGVTNYLGIDLGFWVGMAICIIVFIGMNLVFWNMKSKSDLKRG